MASASRRRQQPWSVPSFTSTSKPQQPVSLSRRLLFPNLPPGIIELPPLLASTTAPTELTSELYDLVALALRAFVNPWWTKITRYDKEFLPEITRILSAVLRAFETCLLATDLSPFVFRDVPTLLTQHYRDYRNAASKLSSSYATGGASSLPQLFHNLQPHIAVSSDGHIDDVYVRHAVDCILKICLPSEDYDPEAERFIVREIILKVLLNDVIPKLVEPWFIQKMILDILGPSQGKPEPPKPPDPMHSKSAISRFSSHSLSFHALLVFCLSAIQSISGVCLALIHAYKHTMNTIKLVNQTHTPSTPTIISSPFSRPIAPRHVSTASTSSSSSSLSLAISVSADMLLSSHDLDVTPISNDYARLPLEMIAEIFTTHNRFASDTLQNSVTMLATVSTPFLDRLLPYLLYTHMFSSSSIVNVVRIAKRTLFPNGYLAQAPPDPSPDEQIAIREALIQRIEEKIPRPLRHLLLGPTPATRLATIEAVLNPLSSTACNAHLVMLLFDLIILTLFPEMVSGNSESAGAPATDEMRVDQVRLGDIGQTASITLSHH